VRPAILCKRSSLCPKGDGGADHMVDQPWIKKAIDKALTILGE